VVWYGEICQAPRGDEIMIENREVPFGTSDFLFFYCFTPLNFLDTELKILLRGLHYQIILLRLTRLTYFKPILAVFCAVR
jgi:hypothetical protein